MEESGQLTIYVKVEHGEGAPNGDESGAEVEVDLEQSPPDQHFDLKPDTSLLNRATTTDQNINKCDKNNGNLKKDKVPEPTEIIIHHGAEKRSRYKPKPITYICTICNLSLPNAEALNDHRYIDHVEEFPHRCNHCKRTFSNAALKKLHETIHDQNRFKGEPQFACDLCDKRYHLKGSLDTHKRFVHLGRSRPKRANRYSQPVKQLHATNGVKNHRPVVKHKVLYKCPHCDLRFVQRSTMTKHMEVHLRERRFECKIGGQRLATSTSLSSHMRNRHQNNTEDVSKSKPSIPRDKYSQPWPCELCSKVFKTPSVLKKHMRYHTGERPFECPECGHRFTIKSDMNCHRKRRHGTGPKPINEWTTYKCLFCGKDGFIKSSDLRNHRVGVHSHIPRPAADSELDKEKPYGCGICGKPYWRKYEAIVCTLMRHEAAPLLRKMFRYKCDACPVDCFGYHSAIALKKHWDLEHPNRPFPVRHRARAGMYAKRTKVGDKLPIIQLNSKQVENIRRNGPPTDVKYEFPLYIEFDLIDIPPRPKRPMGMCNLACDFCGKLIRHERNLKRHIEKFHGIKSEGAEMIENQDTAIEIKYEFALCTLSELTSNLKPGMVDRKQKTSEEVNCVICGLAIKHICEGI